MNILLTTYPEAFVSPGGGEVEFLNLSAHLTSIPILNQIYSHTTYGVKSYTHFIHFSTLPSGIDLVRKIYQKSSAGSKKYLWPLFWPSGEPSSYHFDFLDMFDGVIFKSNVEYELFKETANKAFKPIFINDFVDMNYLNSNNQYAGIFSEIFNLEYKSFYLWVGVIDRNKKQLDFIKKIKNTCEKYIFVGGSTDSEYLDECKHFGKENCIFIDYMDRNSDLLISAYKDCKSYVEFTDCIPGTSLIEALSQGCEVNAYHSEWIDELSKRLNLIESINTFFTDLLEKKVVTLKLDNMSEIFANEYSIKYQLEKLVNQIR